MKISSSFLLPVLLCICFITNLSAQKRTRKTKADKSGSEIIEVKLKNGNILVGELIKLGRDSVVIMNEQFGRIAFVKTEIKSYDGLDKRSDIDGEEWDKGKYQSQYFLSPTARPVGAGNRYYTNFDVFANTFSFGISNNFSVTAGFEAVSIFAGEFPIVYVNPKLSLPAGENLYIAVGTSLFVATFNDEVNLGGLVYGNTTIGSATKNFSVGLGFAYAVGESLDSPLLYQLGFTFPLSKKVSILAESFVTSNIEGLYNLGLRVITKGNIVFDIGISRPTGIGNSGAIGLPLLSLSVPL
ncbi:MAG: hypothetical protein ACJA1A_000179 [Saprospiraceae bacterium]|jgi:hypothetical protein|tara:strand:+ start:527 stop:1420 length:894 start_codon:yes stop_codon:yes gene_type:complete